MLTSLYQNPSAHVHTYVSKAPKILHISAFINNFLQYVQELPHLKLLVGQLVALRIQHGRSPVDHLRRVINRDLRPISLPRSTLSLSHSLSHSLPHSLTPLLSHSLTPSLTPSLIHALSPSLPPSLPPSLSKGAHQRLVAVRWYDHLSALHIMSWLLLGAMSHNAVHQVTQNPFIQFQPGF